jgi:small subunit ribosomal protein S9
MVTPKTTSKTAVKKPSVAKKKKVVAEEKHKSAPVAEVISQAPVQTAPAFSFDFKEKLPKGKYIFATGRRKTAIANIRLFSGEGESMVNKKPIETIITYKYHLIDIYKPFELTGLKNAFHFIANVSGGGSNAQATAIQHGIATALSKLEPELRKVLKKNGLLTRDDRKKERKKPGLKRARRAPQWAKR